MTKKIVGILLSIVVFAFCAVTAFANENIMSVGDEVRLVYTIEDVRNVAGVSVETVYNSEYLTAENIVCNISGSETNIKNPGEIKWNFLVYNGMDFNNTDVATVTFKVLKRCTADDLGFEYNCRECFDPDIQKISDNPNSLFSVRAIHRDIEYTVNTIDSENNINSDSDIPDIKSTVSDTDITNKTADTDTPKTTNITTDTDNPQNTYTDKSSNRTSEKNIVIVKNTSDNTTNTITLTTAYSENISNTAVDTSGSQNLTVIILFMILSFSGMLVIGLRIENSR